MSEQGVLTAQKVYLAQYDLSGNLTMGALECGVEGQDSTRFSTAIAGTTSRTEDPGLAYAQFEADSLFEAGTGAIDTVVDSLRRTADIPLTYCPLTGAAGERAYLLRVMESRYRHGGKMGDMHRAQLSSKCSGKWLPGNLLFNGSVSGTTTGSGFLLGSVGATQSVYAWQHTLSGTGSLSGVISSDDNSGFISPTTRGAFADIAAPGTEVFTVAAGPITDTYWRVGFTIASGGPFAVVIGLAIL